MKYLSIIIVAIALTGCGPKSLHFKHKASGPIFFDYASHHTAKPIDAGPCPTCGGDSTDPVIPDNCDNHGNSDLNDDRTDHDQHNDNGEDNNDHEGQHDDVCAPVSVG